jgi:hypothetical protein
METNSQLFWRAFKEGFILGNLAAILGIMLALVLSGCAHVSDYDSAPTCPTHMTEEQKASGRVQCRAECASWARDMIEFDDECRCICAQPHRVGHNANTQI